jgi:hypothetical protein
VRGTPASDMPDSVCCLPTASDNWIGSHGWYVAGLQRFHNRKMHRYYFIFPKMYHCSFHRASGLPVPAQGRTRSTDPGSLSASPEAPDHILQLILHIGKDVDRLYQLVLTLTSAVSGKR